MIWKLLVGKIKCGKSRIHHSCFAFLPAMLFFACEPVWNKTRDCCFTCAFSLCIDPVCSAGEALPKVPKPAAFGYNRSSRFYLFIFFFHDSASVIQSTKLLPSCSCFWGAQPRPCSALHANVPGEAFCHSKRAPARAALLSPL